MDVYHSEAACQLFENPLDDFQSRAMSQIIKTVKFPGNLRKSS